MESFYDFRTGHRIIGVLVFPSDEHGECAYSPAFFAAQSEHVVIETPDSFFCEG